MLITVTTASQSLEKILSAPQKAIVKKVSTSGFKIVIQNLWTQDIYVDYGYDISAATTTGIKIVQNDTMSCNLKDYAELNLISNATSNTNVRIAIAA